MFKRLIGISLAGLVYGCTSVPVDSHLQADELVASEGVLAYFSDPDVDAVEIGGNIQCKRHKLVGTHLISKVCRTRQEWDELKRRTKETHMDHRTAPICVATAANGTYMRDGPGALMPTACGEAINRGN